MSLISLWNDIKHWLASKQSECMGSELWKGSLFRNKLGWSWYLDSRSECIRGVLHLK